MGFFWLNSSTYTDSTNLRLGNTVEFIIEKKNLYISLPM